MILTTEEAADELKVSPVAVRQMVHRRQLKPLRAKARPLLFRLDDVIELAARRMTMADHDRLDTLAKRLSDETAKLV